MKVYRSFSYLMAIASLLFLLASCHPSGYHRHGRKGASVRKERNASRNYTPVAAKPANRQTGTYRNSVADAETELRRRIVDKGLSLKGTAYKYGGKSPASGFDCSGFTGYVFTQSGIPMAGPSYSLARLGRRKEPHELTTGDLVFFGNGEKISHVGIVIRNEKGILDVVHATNTSGVKTENVLQSAYWKSRLLFGTDILTGQREISLR